MPSKAGGSLSGQISLNAQLKDKVKVGSTLYIIVRRDEGEGKKGMMIAAKKIPVTGPDMFPHSYTITGRDVMMAGTALAGNVRVSARVDQDGDALSKQPGDVTGAAPKAAKVGEKAVNVALDSSI